MAKHLNIDDFSVIQMNGDGNCCFHALAAGIHGFYEMYAEENDVMIHIEQMRIRLEVMTFIQDNIEEFQEFYPIRLAASTTQGLSTDEIDKLIDDMSATEKKRFRLEEVSKISQDTFWGGECEVKAAAMLYERRIHIYNPGGQDVVFDYDNAYELKPPVYLKYVHPHYDLLKRITRSTPAIQPPLGEDVFEWLQEHHLQLHRINPGKSNLTMALAFAMKNNMHLNDVILRVLKKHMLGKESKWNNDMQIVVNDKYNFLNNAEKQRYIEKKVKWTLRYITYNDKIILDEAAAAFYIEIKVIQNLTQNPDDYNFLNSVNGSVIYLLKTDIHYDVVTKRAAEVLPSLQNPSKNENKPRKQPVTQDMDEIEVIDLTDPCFDTPNPEDWEGDVILLDTESVEAPVDVLENNYILSSILRNFQSPVTVVVLVPRPFLDLKNLQQVFESNISLAQLTVVVLYNVSDYAKMKKDQYLKNGFTMFAKTVKGEFNTMDRRILRLAKYILPLIFLATEGYKWRGIPIRTICKSQAGSVPLLLLTHSWKDIREAVKQEVDNVKTEGLFFMNSLSAATGTFKTRYNASRFHRIQFDTASLEDGEVTRTGDSSLERFDFFVTLDNNVMPVPEVVAHFRDKCNVNEDDKIDNLYMYLNELETNTVWYTYFVILFDGPQMNKYKNEANPEATTKVFFEMMEDTCVEKTLYMGRTRNQAFRSSHFTQDSALNEILTSTTIMYNLRSIKFNDMDSCKQDEAKMLVLTDAYLKMYDSNPAGIQLLLLNKHLEYMPLVNEDANVFYANVKAFLNSGVHLLKMRPDQEAMVYEHEFICKGNLTALDEIKVLRGTYSNRTFDCVQEVYTRLKANMRHH